MLRLKYPVLLLALCLVATACSQEEVEQLKGHVAKAQQAAEVAESVVATAQNARDTIESYVASLPEGETRDKWLERLEKAEDVLVKAQAGAEIANVTVTRLKAALADAQDEWDVADGVVGAVSPLIPPPWGAIAAAVATLAIGLLRSASRKKAAMAIVRAIEDAKVDGKVDFEDPDVRVAMTASMGPAGRALVDEAQGKRKSLPV